MASPEMTKQVQWQVPTYSSNRDNWKELHSWFLRQISDGQEYLRASPGYEQLEESVRLLSGQPSPELAARQKQGYSQVQSSRLKRDLREMVNSLSEVKWNPSFHASVRNREADAHVLNRVGQWWYLDTDADLKIRKVCQWMAISPCGWGELCYRRVPGRSNSTLIDIIPHSAFDVVMTGIPESGDFQEAYTVTIIKDMPVYLAHSLWPDYQADLRPDRETPRGWFDRLRDKLNDVMAGMLAEGPPDQPTARNPTCRIYYQYVIDLSINRTGHDLYMGYEKRKVRKPRRDSLGNEIPGQTDEVTEQVETPWSYKVPSLGSMIPSQRDSVTGAMQYRPATEDDCRIFPGRRLIVGNDQRVFYDGPMFDLHGRVPLFKLAADSWPFGEFSMVHDIAPLQEAINEVERIIHQAIRRRYKPPMKYNLRAIQREKVKSLNLDSDQRVGYNGQEGTGDNILSGIFPDSHYAVEGYVQDFLKYLIESMDDQAGRQSAVALSKMKAMGGGDSLERLLELVGPIVRGIAREMERSMRDLADMFKYLVYQYLDAPRLLPIVGEAGVTPATFDYDPGNLIPSHLPGEPPNFPSVHSRQRRARWACEHVNYLVQPGTMHEITQMSQKLLYLQLWRGGFKISSYDLAEVMRLPGYGIIEGSTMRERWANEKKADMQQETELKIAAAHMMQEAGLDPSGGADGGGGSGGGPSGQGPKGGFKGGGGRPPSGQAAPKLQTKGDGRPVVRESP